jgi:hypothetical protein
MDKIIKPFPKTIAMYRRMLKTMMVVFEGDYEMFHRARIELRQSIVKEKDEVDLMKINELLFQYEESRRVLLKNVVQGTL